MFLLFPPFTVPVRSRASFLRCVLHRSFMKRPDVRHKCLVPFLDWSLGTVLQKNDKLLEDITVLDGTLNSLVKRRITPLPMTRRLMSSCPHLPVCSKPV